MRFLFLLVLLSPLLAIAGNAPAGAPCSNPNQCLSHTCSQKRCAPSTDYPAGIGGFCSTNGTCKSKNCVRSKCEAPKEEKKTSSTKGGGSTRSAPDDDEDEEEAPKAKEPEPLPEPTPCSEDLLATIYKGDKSRTHQFYARDNCKYPPEVLAKAKKLFLDGYGYNFAITLSTVHNATPEQLDCAIKHYDLAKKGSFDVPRLCMGKKELIACADELAPLFIKFEEMKPEMAKDQAEIACEKREPAVIARAKPLLIEKYGHFDHICDTIEKATPEQVECVKREYVITTNNRTKYDSFTLRGVCETDPATWSCYFDLLEGVLKEKSTDDRFRSSIASACKGATPEDLALAKQIFSEGLWTGYFPSLLDGIHDLKPEKRACLKKNYKSMPYKDSFYLPKVCDKK